MESNPVEKQNRSKENHFLAKRPDVYGAGQVANTSRTIDHGRAEDCQRP